MLITPTPTIARRWILRSSIVAAFTTLLLLTALLLALPSIVGADDGTHYQSTESYDALDNYEYPACSGSGKDHETEVKYQVSSNPHRFTVDYVKQWGRITDYGLARNQEWTSEFVKYFKVVNGQYVHVTTKGAHPVKRSGGHCSNMDSPQTESGDVALDGGGLIETQTRYDWCVANLSEGDCPEVSFQSFHALYLQD